MKALTLKYKLLELFIILVIFVTIREITAISEEATAKGKDIVIVFISPNTG